MATSSHQIWFWANLCRVGELFRQLEQLKLALGTR